MSSRASSFGRRAADYDRVRPDYPLEAIDHAVSRLGLGPEAEVLDLGAGTGKLTRPLVERVGRVAAVDPDPEMLAVLSRVTDCYLAVEGSAEAIPLESASVDAVFAGQAFHWFATEAALAEIARVLRPRGGLALIWNEWWATEPPVPPAAAEVLRRAFERPELEPLSTEEGWWRECFANGPFEALRTERLASEAVTLDAERLVTLILSTSVFGSLPPDRFDEAESELRRLVVGEYRLPIETELNWTQLSR